MSLQNLKKKRMIHLIEFDLEVLIIMIVGITAIGSIITGGVIKIFNKGKQAGIDKACGERIEKKIDDLKNELGEHEDDSNHDKSTIHKRIDETHERITEVATQVASVEGKQDTMMEFLKEKL